MKRLQTWHWLLAAVLIRCLAALTRVNWHYPDEWYQTIEFSRLLLGDGATRTHEMILHLRNLSWPIVLCLPLELAKISFPGWTHLRLIAAQLLAGALDLAAIWAFSRMSKNWSAIWRSLGFALLILPWFQVQDSVSLGSEHCCVCLIWLALWAIQARRFRIAGILALGIFAAKYPAGLVSLGLSIAVFAQSFRAKDRKIAIHYGLGLLCGALLFGLGDWIFYGRPWESLWMYLQYNVFTSAGLDAFGRQGIGQYLGFFRSRWLGVLAPLGIALAVGGAFATVRGFRKFEPWAWGFVLYLVGHLCVSHREPRFMFPAEALLLWGTLQCFSRIRPSWRPQRWVAVVLGISFLANLPFFLKAIWAETGTLNSRYFDVDRRLAENPGSCAVISQRPLNSLLMQSSPTYGYFTAQRRRPTFPQASTRVLAWYVNTPRCLPSQSVLLLVDRPDVAWVENGCRLEESGLLAWLPHSLWVPFLRRGWVSGPWYVCPSRILAEFKNQTQEDPFIHRFPHFNRLPPLGIDARELLRFRDQASAPPHCSWTCL